MLPSTRSDNTGAAESLMSSSISSGNRTSSGSSHKPVLHTPSTALVSSAHGQTDGMIRENALVGVADDICASRMTAKPHSQSAVHHHGDQNTIVYAISGIGVVVSDGGASRKTLRQGDFALIPAFAEHQEVNESDEDVVWCIVRSGPEPCVVNLPGWSVSTINKHEDW